MNFDDRRDVALNGKTFIIYLFGYDGASKSTFWNLSAHLDLRYPTGGKTHVSGSGGVIRTLHRSPHREVLHFASETISPQ